MKWLAASLLLASACQRGSGGDLEPVVGNGVERAGANEAVVHADGVSATVSARWASQDGQSADITYVNTGQTPATIILSRLKLSHRLGDAPLWGASDMTGIDYEDARTDNDTPPDLYDLDKDGRGVGAPLVLKPGERRVLNLGFTYLAGEGEDRIKEGDRVTITVPLGRRDAVVTFEAE